MHNLINKMKSKTDEKKQKKIIDNEREAYHKAILGEEKRRDKSTLTPPLDSYISLKNINKIYPNHVQAVYDFSLDIKKHEFIVFVGPSGCGKSTTLRMIAGLEEITSGDLWIDNEYANDLTPKERDIAMVFQSYALYPHMTVRENMSFGLKINHYKKEEIEERVNKAAEILQLKEYLDRKPNALSGGQMQRVALGRAIVRNSKVFLMDEPLSNLDAKLRVQMRSEIVKLHEKINATTIYVTHDQTEAMTMATRIVVMNKGFIQQIGTPEEIYNEPKNIFVASFIGSPTMNLVDGVYSNKQVELINGHNIKLDSNLLPHIQEFYKDKFKELNDFIENKRKIYCARSDIKIKTVPSFDTMSDKKINKYLLTTNSKLGIEEHIVNKAPTEKKLQCYKNFLKVNCRPSMVKEIEEINDLSNIQSKVEQILKDNNFRYLLEKDNDLASKIKMIDDIKEIMNNSKIKLVIGIRPEDIEIAEGKSYNVNVAELLGSEYYLHVELSEGHELIIKAPISDYKGKGDLIDIKIKEEKLHFFDPITSEKIL